MNLFDCRKVLEQKKGQHRQVLRSVEDVKTKIKGLKVQGEDIETAQVIIKEVAQRTQQKLEYRISEIVSLALSTVFGDDAYEFKIKIIPKRGKTEAQLLFVRNGREMHPMDASSGGHINVASFALRIALWTLKTPRSRNVFILDQPFGDVSQNYLPAVCNMLKILSKKFNIQIILITHTPRLVFAADKIFCLVLKNGVTQISEMSQEEAFQYLKREEMEE